MHNLFASGAHRPRLLIGTAKVALAIVVTGCLTAIFLSSQRLDDNGLGRIVAVLAELPEPVTTGSILQSARNTKIDPCVLSQKP
jgi:hypothetical protein